MEYPYLYKQLRPLVLFLHDYKCNLCHSGSNDMQVDHRDGNIYNNSPYNLQPLCRSCHDLKKKFKMDIALDLTPAQILAFERIKSHYKKFY